jgi:hypothetical protein
VKIPELVLHLVDAPASPINEIEGVAVCWYNAFVETVGGEGATVSTVKLKVELAVFPATSEVDT